MKNNATYYKQAIKLLAVQKDWKDICVTIAMKHPKVFVDACPVTCPDEFEDAVIAEYKKAGMIPAIKYIRASKGLGLKQANDYVIDLKARHRL